MNIKQAQKLCCKLKEKGDCKSLAKAKRIETKFKNHPEYESDLAWLLRKQSGN